jgi:ribosome biogenesis GTPase
MKALEKLGWDTFFQREFEPYRLQGFTAGRVSLEHRRAYTLYTEAGEMQGEVRGKLRFQAAGRVDFPAVGDWVVITAYPDQNRASIHAILPRKSKFSRKAAGRVTQEQVVAANVDTVFLVQGLDRDYNLRRLERYLVMALESGGAPVIILNKADLCDDVGQRLREVEANAPGVPVHAISSVTGRGVDELGQYLQAGRTVAFLGSSGVGKSTLINRLVGRDIQKVRDVRKSDGRGRHTTSSRELILLESGGMVVDTPGMRELQLWNASEALSDSFADVEEVAATCRFSDCAHEGEPGCAVAEAVEDGMMEGARVESYRKLQKELDYLDSRQDLKKQLERKAGEKRIHRVFNHTRPKRTSW